MVEALLQMDLMALPWAFNFIMMVLLAVAVLSHEHFSRESRLYANMIWPVVLWQVGKFFQMAEKNVDYFLFFDRIQNFGVPFIAVAAFQFSSAVLHQDRENKLLIPLGWALAMVFAILSVSTNFVFDGILEYSWGYSSKPGPLWWPFQTFIVSFLLLTTLNFFRAYRSLDRRFVYRKRLRLFTVGIFLGSLGVVDFLPDLGFDVVPIGYLPTDAFFLLSLYAIWKYRLVDISPSMASPEILHALFDPVLVLDLKRHVRLSNLAADREFGVLGKGLRGSHYLEFAGGRLLQPYLNDLENNEVLEEFTLERWSDHHNEMRSYQVRAELVKDSFQNMLGSLWILRDVTQLLRERRDRIRLEEHFQRSQKMEAIGTLASGIAHDFNNILAVVLGNIDLLEKKLAGKNEKKKLERIRRASQRGKELVQNILSFTRKKEDKSLQPIRLDFVLQETIGMLTQTIPSNVSFHPMIERIPNAILADELKVQRIIMNLCINGLHAMEKENHGSLELRCKLRHLPAPIDCLNRRLDSGDYYEIEVRDSGTGIDKNMLKRIFDPFFTTKMVGKGSGMGLSILYGLVEELRAGILVESKVGVGSSFFVFFEVLPVTGKCS